MNFLLKSVLFSLVLTIAHCSNGDPKVEVEEEVLVLTTANFDHVISKNQHVLVEFYAPWCGHCKALAPEYAKAASTLKEEGSEVKLAKVDATVESELGKKYGVQGYPTLKFFKNGKALDYQGGRQAPDIVSWLKKKTGPPSVVLESAEALNKFKEDNEVAVLGHYESPDSENAKTYDNVASAINDVAFGVVYDPKVAKEVELAMDHLVVFKQVDGKVSKSAETNITIDSKLGPWLVRETSPLLQEMNEAFDEGRVDYTGDITDAEAITDFIKKNQLRLVSEFTAESAPKIFGGEIQVHNLLFVSKASDDFDKHYAAFKEAAAEFKGKVLFIYIDTDQEDNKRVMEFFGLTEADVPDYRIIKMSENMAKFKPDTKDLSKEAVIKFTGDVESGAVKRHLMTQDIPEDWNKNPVTVLVGKNFREVAFDKSKKVFVEFYAPWCGHCKALKPIWEKLGEKFKDDDNVVIAMMDSTANEVADFEIQGFPTLKYFPSGDDESKVLDYNGDRTLDAMFEYVTSNGEKVSGGDDEGEEDVDEDEGGIPSGDAPPTETAPPSLDSAKEEIVKDAKADLKGQVDEEFGELPDEEDAAATDGGKDEL